MNFKETLQSLSDKFTTSGDVKKIFGEPIERNGKTIIPVASISYGLGGGGGERKGEENTSEGGEGGGGGIMARPIGVVEITETGTRFIRFNQVPVLLGIAVVAFSLNAIIKQILKRRK